MTTLPELKASSLEQISWSRLVVLQSKRLMLGMAERRYRGTSSHDHLRRVERLRSEVNGAQERYARTPWTGGQMGADPMRSARMLQACERSLDKLRALQPLLPPD